MLLSTIQFLATLALGFALLNAPAIHAQDSPPPTNSPPLEGPGLRRAEVATATQAGMGATVTLHPALFLVGDSIMKTGTGNGEHGPWGWGSEIIPLFDEAKIHVYNEGHGGRSSRSFIDEGL